MACRSIVVVTNPDDEHAATIAHMLHDRGHTLRFVHPGDLATSGSITVDVGTTAPLNMTIVTGGGRVDVDDIGAVWWRKPSRVPTPARLTPNEQIFAERELNGAHEGVWKVLHARRPELFWMSHPDHQRAASNKIEQLHNAAALGFSVPRTLVSNDGAAIREFYRELAGDIVYKPVVQGVIGSMVSYYHDPGEPARMTFCVPMDEDLLDKYDEVREVPGTFQQRVPKARELRVTVFDGQVFAAAIASQSNDRTMQDWRIKPGAVTWSVVTLPDAVRDRCLTMLERYGLTYGAFDFVETPDGELVFIELNPNGQWIFVQELCPQLKMAQALCDLLIART